MFDNTEPDYAECRLIEAEDASARDDVVTFERVDSSHTEYIGEGVVLKTYIDAYDTVIDVVEYEDECILAIAGDSEYHISVEDIEANEI